MRRLYKVDMPTYLACLWMICGLAVTLLSFSTGLAVPWLIAAIALTVITVALLVLVPPEAP